MTIFEIEGSRKSRAMEGLNSNVFSILALVYKVCTKQITQQMVISVKHKYQIAQI